MTAIRIVIEAEVEKTSGKFVSREALGEEIVSELQGADPGSLSVDDSEYDVTSWEVELDDAPTARRQVAPPKHHHTTTLETLWQVLGPMRDGTDPLAKPEQTLKALRTLVGNALGLNLAQMDQDVKL